MTVESSMTSVSVIIPTCARPIPLQRALASVRAQETAPLEVIVVDDGPPAAADDVRGVIAGAGLERVSVTENARAKGPSGARNCGARRAAGTVLAFLDDDDEWLPGYLSQALRPFATGDIDVVCTDLLYRYDDGSERQGKTAPETLSCDAFLVRNPGIIGSNLVISKALYTALDGFDESLLTFEDVDFGFRLSGHSRVRYARLAQRLVRHYQHTQARLCTRSGDAMRAGVRRFFELYALRMNDTQRDAFRHLVRELWSIDEYGHSASVTALAAPS